MFELVYGACIDSDPDVLPCAFMWQGDLVLITFGAYDKDWHKQFVAVYVFIRVL
jgi:hypothetical protein